MPASIKDVILVCLLAFIPNGLCAQLVASANTLRPVSVSPVVVDHDHRVAYNVPKLPGMRMINTGKTLTIIGGGLIVGGFIVYSNRDNPDAIVYGYSNGTYTYYNKYEVIGQVMVGVGTGMAIPGIIVWSKGSKKFKRYVQERQSALTLTGTGLSLTYRF